MNKKDLEFIRIVTKTTIKRYKLHDLDNGAMLGAACEAYVKAMKTYDTSKNVLFKTYAEIRMKFAIIDEVRLIYGRTGQYENKYKKGEWVDYNVEKSGSYDLEGKAIFSLDLESFLKKVKLTKRQKDIFIMRVTGHTGVETAKKHGISDSQVSLDFKVCKGKVGDWFK